MTPHADRQARRYPLQFTIAFVFSALFLLVGIALISYNYHETQKMTLLGADRLLAGMGRHLETTVSDLYRPVRNLADISSRVLSSEDSSLTQRLDSLPFLAEPLRLNANISAVFMGYDDGDFFLVRRLSEGWEASEMGDPPARTQYLVQSVDHRDGEETLEEWLFYDQDLLQLGRKQVGDTGFDPRQRQWYTGAMASDEAVTSEFYVFFTTRETGITVARQLADGGGAVGADLALVDLERGLAHQKVTPETKIAVLDRNGGVIALSELREEIPLQMDEVTEQVHMPLITDLSDPVFQQVGESFMEGDRSGRRLVTVEDRDWLVSISRIEAIPEEDVYLAVLVPRDELLAAVTRVRNNGTLISLVLLIGALALVAYVARNISRSISALAQEAEKVREFQFDSPITAQSRIREVDDLAGTMGLMKSSIQQFLDISQALSAEKDIHRVLEMVLTEAIKVSQADGGSILMMTEDHQGLEVAILANHVTETHYGGTSGETPPFETVDLEVGGDPPSVLGVDQATASGGEVVRIEDVDRETDYDTAGIRSRYDEDGYKIRALLSVPLRNQLDEVIGVLQIVRSAGTKSSQMEFRPEIVPYIEALSSDAAVALDIRALLKAQRDLLDSLIHMIAGAIDAKSPYTHGHCQRVPVVARKLAEAAHNAAAGTFAQFQLSENGWYQLHLASWLHDCGKVTTPEYVVDKATKLETIYNRIHEIRMRFEALWRDAEIDYYKGLAAGETEEKELREKMEERHTQLQEDFEFIATCNLGEEGMSEERMERVQSLASTPWVRHLDDRLGLSHGELLLNAEDPKPLPAVETLLADKPEHIIPRAEGQSPFGDEPHDFRMAVPEHQYNRGEVHNICIARGTLTTEERFKINEHVIQTFRMLERLPFPRDLKEVPDWAANHHEKLDGTGYPRRLEAEDLSVPERIMAIADIFEALTARDRPYHPPRSLSQAIGVMSSMCSQGHLCPDLFDLFLTSGVYLDYGKEYLDPRQIDPVDITAMVGTARA